MLVSIPPSASPFAYQHHASNKFFAPPSPSPVYDALDDFAYFTLSAAGEHERMEGAGSGHGHGGHGMYGGGYGRSYPSKMLAQFQSQQQPQQPQQQPSTSNAIQTTTTTMRLRDDPPQITARSSRKRKSPSMQSPVHHVLPPPHALVHTPPLPPGYSYAPPDYAPAAIPQPVLQQPQQQPSESPPATGPGGRALSNSKRAEQNRKAQRAFRERRDQHVKALESRSQLLDAALASADEANRRWEECRVLVDQLRAENNALRAENASFRAALAQLPPGTSPALPPPAPTPHDAAATTAPQERHAEQQQQGERARRPTPAGEPGQEDTAKS